MIKLNTYKYNNINLATPQTYEDYRYIQCHLFSRDVIDLADSDLH